MAIANLLIKDPETFYFFVENGINLFHGTNANALPSILQNGLNSHVKSESEGIEVITGEDSTRTYRKRSFVSLTDSLDLAKELLTYLGYFDSEIINKIPDYLIHFLSNKAASSEKDYYLYKNKKLLEQDMSEDCKDLLAIIYFSYLVEKGTKQELLANWLDNGE